jgi:hypothetical protein
VQFSRLSSLRKNPKIVVFGINKNDKCVDLDLVNSAQFEILAGLLFLMFPKYNDFSIGFLHTSRSHNSPDQDFLS